MNLLPQILGALKASQNEYDGRSNSLEKDGRGDKCEAKVEVRFNDVKYATVLARSLHHGLSGDKARCPAGPTSQYYHWDDPYRRGPKGVARGSVWSHHLL